MGNSSNEMAEQFYQYVEEYLEKGEYIYAKRAFHNWLRYQPRPSCEKYEKAITAILLGEVGAKEEKDVVQATRLMSKCGLYRELQNSPYVSQEIKQRYQILAKLQEKYQGATLVNQVRENYRWRSNTIGVLGIVVMVALYVFLAILIARGVLANKELYKNENGTDGHIGYIILFIFLHSIPWAVASSLWSCFYKWGYSLIPTYEYRVVFQKRGVLIELIQSEVDFLYDKYEEGIAWNKTFFGKDLWTDFVYRAMKDECYCDDSRMNNGLELYFISPKTTKGVAQKAFIDCIYFQYSMEDWKEVYEKRRKEARR